MITRYEVKEVSNLWNDENKFKSFFTIEISLLHALEHFGKIPKGIKEKFNMVEINPERIHEIEITTKHDVIAFCSSITEQVDAEYGKYFHYGVTSSDIIDSALSLMLKANMEIIRNDLTLLIKTIEKRAIETKDWLTIGRSHGMYAEPMSFGQKFLSYSTELKRRLNDLNQIMNDELTIQLSGSIGNYALISPEIELFVANKLGLKVETLSTQIIPRDRLAKILQLNALISCAVERVCLEIRHLHHSDIKELAEGFAKGQKGSSIMPHKKNPISSENLTGISRLLRSHTQVALENTQLWHERDISHSSAERMILPDNFGLLSYMLKRATNMIDNLELYRDNIEKKVTSNALYLSSYYMHFLIANIPQVSREEIYKTLQTVSFKEEVKTPEIFRAVLIDELKKAQIIIDLPKVDTEGLRKIYLSHIDEIFNRCLS